MTGKKNPFKYFIKGIIFTGGFYSSYQNIYIYSMKGGYKKAIVEIMRLRI